jgi:hypothetical protein
MASFCEQVGHLHVVWLAGKLAIHSIVYLELAKKAELFRSGAPALRVTGQPAVQSLATLGAIATEFAEASL